MHEDLLGYLLGALEPHEMRRVAEWLREDPQAREELARIEASLRPLEDAFYPVEPPPSDLVERTLNALPPLPDPSQSVSAESGTTGSESPGQPIESARIPAASDSLVAMAPAIDAPPEARLTWFDWFAGSSAVAVILALLLPTLAEGRFESRKIACQDQLRQLGTAITQYVNRNHQDRLPAVAEAGPEAFAGVYAVRLHDAGLLNDPSIRWCPSLEPPRPDELTLTGVNEIASTAELYQTPVDRLRQIQQFAGGHYAYTLGVMERQQLAPPRFEARSSFAVLSDAPLSGLADRETLTQQIGHGGLGINVLYEDGRIRFVPIEALDSMPDHPLLNHHGRIEAGVNVDDAVLAPSWRAPFVDVPQR